MIWIHLLIVLLAIFLGARLGGIGIGFAGGLGVVALALTGAQVRTFHVVDDSVSLDIPVDVVIIIMAVIAAIAAMQVAGGLDHLVHLADVVLRRNPRHLIFLAPIITYLMTWMAGTGHTAFSTMPVITEVAKENNIRPSRPLSIAVIASQIAITASPISAAVVWLSSALAAPHAGQPGVDYLQILAITFVATFPACMIVAALMLAWDRWVNKRSALEFDPVYRERAAAGLVHHRDSTAYRAPRGARASVLVFLIGLVVVMAYSAAISDKLHWIGNPPMPRDAAIVAIMLSVAAIIVLVARIRPAEILTASTFKSGMSASVCVLGVAWLGTTFVNSHIDTIKSAAGGLLQSHSWLLAVVLFFAASLLYSQAATAKALLPAAIALGVSNVGIMAAFAAVSALFVLPTYPTLLAAVEMDDTGSTRVGKAVFNHPFLVPGVLTIATAVGLGYLVAGIVL